MAVAVFAGFLFWFCLGEMGPMQAPNPTPLESLLREVDQVLVGDLEFIAKCDELLRKCQLLAVGVTQRLHKVLATDSQAGSNPAFVDSAAAARLSRSLPG
jgi:hypothetical protein